MPPRAKPKSAVASPSGRLTLSGVKVGHRARLLDGSVVLLACELGGSLFVRDYDGATAGNGPYEMPRDTPVLDVIAPEVRYSDRSPVKDPLEAV